MRSFKEHLEQIQEGKMLPSDFGASLEDIIEKYRDKLNGKSQKELEQFFLNRLNPDDEDDMEDLKKRAKKSAIQALKILKASK